MISKHELQARREAKAEDTVLVWLIAEGQVDRPSLLPVLIRNCARGGRTGGQKEAHGKHCAPAS